jgi:3-oxoacyl-[acyl-carrier protein] reductase
LEELKGQIALVTGGSRGIGLATARARAEAGATVAVVARDEGRASAAAGELPGEGHRGYAADVADPASVASLIERLESELGVPDILVNNAGITRDNLLMRLKDDEWQEVIDTNLRGAFNTIRALSRGMMKKRGGRIINVSSVVGITGNKGQANYAASKAGLIGLTKSVARELASRGILVNAVAPGYIDTEMTAGLPVPRGTPCSRRSRWAGSAGRRTSPRPSAFWRARVRRTSPARCWWWTEEW